MRACVRGIHYVYILFLRFYVYIFVDHVITAIIIIIICIIITIIIKHNEVKSSHYRKIMCDVFTCNIKKSYSTVDKIFFPPPTLHKTIFRTPTEQGGGQTLRTSR